MVTLKQFPLSGAVRNHLRPVQPQRDLPEVADLVELCFRETLDSEGRSYIRHLRRAAQDNSMLLWASSAIEMMNGVPVAGLVWEEAGHIVGNLSLIPLRFWRKRIYLIANVAVHPDFRGRGIARALMEAALAQLHERQVEAVWLQVRDDNPSAIHIYQSLGFEEQARRTTWLCRERPSAVQLPAGAILGKRRSGHWADQARWLRRLYPEDLRWHLPMRWTLFQPGVWGELTRFFSLEYPGHWTIQRSNRLLAALTSLHEGGQSITLWLAAPPEDEIEPGVVQALLASALLRSDFHRPFSLNLPARYTAGEIQAVGFQAQQTLIWMRLGLSNSI